jgi:hypothetical protein
MVRAGFFSIRTFTTRVVFGNQLELAFTFWKTFAP